MLQDNPRAVQEMPAPGSVLVIRDETWLVTRVERATDGWFVDVQGLEGLVQGTTAIFSSALDKITPLDPRQAVVVADDSPGFRRSRLWLEATLRKSALPLADTSLTVSRQGLNKDLPYQRSAVTKALNPANLRPRILLADTVGLGKTIEIGMILSELVRRGRGDRILVVTPRHVLEQMQFELWTRFALPFVRLDSVGIQRIRQKLPGNRNPFGYFKRAIVSIDTLKSDRYLAHLEKQNWDAVVIDESHNVTNASAQRNRVARILASKADALILASATPHNGRKESFAELIRMLEPSAVGPDDELDEEHVGRLIIRRHRHSTEVADVVGGDWAEREDPRHRLVSANPIENQIVDELVDRWLYPEPGESVVSGNNRLFPWTLAKSFLSSPAAFDQTVRERVRRLKDTPDNARERIALQALQELATRHLAGSSSKYDELCKHLREIGVGAKADTRVVIFSERVPTLGWLQARIRKDLKLPDDAVAVLHGGISDTEQQDLVESFKQESSPIRVLVTGDVASEGVNLHLQCHHLVHYDIPWSLIRIEQRNGRIDRYGQKHSPVITTLILDPASDAFAGDVRVLRSLVEKEHEAHKALGDTASLMGKYDAAGEEDEIRKVLAGEKELDDAVRSVEEVAEAGGFDGVLARLFAAAEANADAPVDVAAAVDPIGVYSDAVEFLRDALVEVFETPGMKPPNGVSWSEHTNHGTVQMVPPRDLCRRLEVLPQTYLRDRGVTEKLVLATTANRGEQELVNARNDETDVLWPEAHYLAPLHPALDWASDRALASLGRNQVFAVAGSVDHPTLLVQGTLTNARGQVVTSTYITAQFPNATNLDFAPTNYHATAREALGALGVLEGQVNRGALDVEGLTRFVGPGVDAARRTLSTLVEPVVADVEARISRWSERTQRWDADADALMQRQEIKNRRLRVDEERELAAAMRPQQELVRPLLLVVPNVGEGRV